MSIKTLSIEQLVMKAKTGYFEGQTGPGEDKISCFVNFCMLLPTIFLVIQNFNVFRTSVKTLAMELVGPNSQKYPF